LGAVGGCTPPKKAGETDEPTRWVNVSTVDLTGDLNKQGAGKIPQGGYTCDINVHGTSDVPELLQGEVDGTTTVLFSTDVKATFDGTSENTIFYYGDTTNLQYLILNSGEGDNNGYFAVADLSTTNSTNYQVKVKDSHGNVQQLTPVSGVDGSRLTVIPELSPGTYEVDLVDSNTNQVFSSAGVNVASGDLRTIAVFFDSADHSGLLSMAINGNSACTKDTTIPIKH